MAAFHCRIAIDQPAVDSTRHQRLNNGSSRQIPRSGRIIAECDLNSLFVSQRYVSVNGNAERLRTTAVKANEMGTSLKQLMTAATDEVDHLSILMRTKQCIQADVR